MEVFWLFVILVELVSNLMSQMGCKLDGAQVSSAQVDSLLVLTEGADQVSHTRYSYYL